MLIFIHFVARVKACFDSRNSNKEPRSLGAIDVVWYIWVGGIEKESGHPYPSGDGAIFVLYPFTLTPGHSYLGNETISLYRVQP